MAVEVEARALVESIRSKLWCLVTNEFVSTLNELLNVTVDLHDNSAQFLLELLQNADDSEFTCTDPMVKLTYRPGSLRVDCNETGFSEENVRAICDIKKSTKRFKSDASRYTGEKGIGFKSVFRVASQVWICSGHYRFKFNKHEPLGMITPTWSDFPEASLPGFTSFYLKLDEDYDASDLEQRLRTFEHVSLLFLRKIREIDLRIQLSDGTYLSRNIRRTDSGTARELSVSQRSVTQNFHYLVEHHHILSLSPVKARPNHVQSELILAFPADLSSWDVRSLRHNVYSFLPVNNYGFKFALQGDFLLTANRQQIDTSSPWNQSLRDGVADAFVRAVRRFNSDESPIKYQWPLYVPGPGTADFFQETRTSILANLNAEPVLETYAQGMAKPSELTYVDPERYADRKGTPFTLSSSTETRYLSSKYSTSAITSILSSFSVRHLSSEQFFSDLRSMIVSDAPSYRRREASWHAQLARILINLNLVVRHKGTLRELYIIPLANGHWTCAATQPVFVSESHRHANLSAHHAGFQVVDHDIMEQVDRRELFEKLGVATVTDTLLCEHISVLHASRTFRPELFTRTQLIFHARLLYKERWIPTDLWLVASDGQYLKGSKLYIPGGFKNNSPTAKVFRRLPEIFPLIHPEYISSSNGDKRFISYLIHNLYLSKVPRLVTFSKASRGGFKLSDEFKTIFEKCPTADALGVLHDHWSVYYPFIRPDTSEELADELSTSRDALVKAIRSLKVETSNGQQYLSTTVIPGLDPVLEEDFDHCTMPVLTMDKRKARDMRPMLENFDVYVHNDVSYYIDCLIWIKETARPQKEAFTHIYEALQSRFDSNDDPIEDLFKENALIYLPSVDQRLKRGRTKESSCWFTVDECANLGKTPEKEYPSCHSFFRSLLVMAQGQLPTLVQKAASVKPSTKLNEITECFLQLSKVMPEMSARGFRRTVRLLRNKPILPITMKGNQSTLPNFYAADDTSKWFIADRSHLRGSFIGVVPLLAFSVSDVVAMEDLLRALQLDARRLSKLAQSNTIAHRPFKFSDSKSKYIRRRVPFIDVLIPKSKSDSERERILKQLNNIRVSTADAIITTYKISHEGHQYKGTGCKARAAASLSNNTLQIYVPEHENTSRYPSFELVDEIAKHCGIDTPASVTLLYAALGEDSIATSQLTFEKSGLHVALPNSGESSSARWLSLSGGLVKVPNPLRYTDSDDDSTSGSDWAGPFDGFTLRLGRRKLKKRAGNHRHGKFADRRLKMMNIIDGEIDFSDDLTDGKTRWYWSQCPDPDRELQYLGERLLSQVFENELGRFYDPNIHWVSPLRTRAGLPGFGEREDHSWASSFPFMLVGDSMGDAARNFLLPRAPANLIQRIKESRVFFFEIASSGYGSDASIPWSTTQMENIHNFWLNEMLNESSGLMLILVRIGDMYTHPYFEYHFQPWELFASGILKLRPGWACEIIETMVESSMPRVAGSRTAAAGHRAIESNQHSVSTMQAQILPDLCPWRTPETGGTFFAKDVKSTYNYQPLREGEIRLLTVFPGEPTDPLRGMICTVAFEHAGIYKTLSYTWGEENQSMHRLSMPDGDLLIRTSLDAALRRLRRRENSIALWVDAICINQQDEITEKPSQIRLLGRIFQEANCTLAFLGADQESSCAIETLMQIRAKGIYGTCEKHWPKCLPACAPSWSEMNIPRAEDPIWQQIVAFFQRPWFRRAWVVQEAIAAPVVKVVCGKWIIDWDDLFLAIEHVERDIKCIPKVDRTAWQPFLTLARHREWEARHTRWSLIRMLETFRHVESGRMRDRLFALLGLAADGDRDEFEPDYQSDFEVIVSRFAEAFVCDGHGIELLTRAGLNPQSDRFPSWIPDWTVPRQISLSDSFDRGGVYNASGDSEGEFSVTKEQDFHEICVQGVLLSHIVEVSKNSNLPDGGDSFKNLKMYIQEVDKMVDKYLSQQSESDRERVKWQVPIAYVEPEDPDVIASSKALRKILKKDKYQGSKKQGLVQKAITSYLEADPNILEPESAAPEEECSAADDGLVGLVEKSKAYLSLLKGPVQGWRFVVTNTGLGGVAPNISVGSGILVGLANSASTAGLTYEPLAVPDNPVGSAADPGERMSSYYDVDAILTDSQKLPCTFELDVPGLGYIEGNAGGTVKAGTKVDLPMWLGVMLAVSTGNTPGSPQLVTLDFPAPLQQRVINALKADPKTVDLRAQAPHFYALGARIMELFDDRAVLDTLLDTFKERAAEIADQAHNPRGVLGEGAEFLRGLDESERQLFKAAHEGPKAVRAWTQDLRKNT